MMVTGIVVVIREMLAMAHTRTHTHTHTHTYLFWPLLLLPSMGHRYVRFRLL